MSVNAAGLMQMYIENRQGVPRVWCVAVLVRGAHGVDGDEHVGSIRGRRSLNRV